MAFYFKQIKSLCIGVILLAICALCVKFFNYLEKSGTRILSAALSERSSESYPWLPTLPKSATWLHSLEVNRQRLQHLRNACEQYGTGHYNIEKNSYETMKFFLMDEPDKLLYCYIPKVGTSTMKRVFSILENRTVGQNLFDISGRTIHREQGAFSRLRDQVPTFPRMHQIVDSFTKIMFVREPYERLFSAFMDRMFAIGDTIKKVDTWDEVRAENADGCIRARLTFSHVVLRVTHAPLIKLNEHFVPHYQICLPCHLSYDYVGKMETFVPDIKNILMSLGVNMEHMTGLSEDEFDITSELSIVRDVSARAFELMIEDNLKCFTKLDIFRRVWVTFQVRGYLSINDSFPLKSQEEAERLTPEEFQRMTREAYLRVQDRTAVRQQRSQALREAYYSVPRALLYKLQDVFQRDCDLFDYDCDVDRRFPESEAPEPVFKLDQM